MKILWAVRIGDPDYYEQVITEQAADPAKLEAATEWAKAQGFDRFRIADVDLTGKPDFAKTVNL